MSPASAVVDLPEGASALLIRVPAVASPAAPAVARDHVGADRPVGFSAAEAGATAHAAK